MTTEMKCTKCGKEWTYKGENKTHATCPDCRYNNKIPVILVAVLFIVAIGASTAYGESFNLLVDTENLNGTHTAQNNQTHSDGSLSVFTSIVFHHWFPADKGPSSDVQLVTADPEGTIFDSIIEDGAKIFQAIFEPIFFGDEEESEVEEPEKIGALTKPEQEALNRLKDECDFEGGEGKAFAFQGVYEIFLEHPIEWYAKVENKDARDEKYEECRGLKQIQLIANQTIGSRVINETDTFIFTPTDQTKYGEFDYSIAGDIWNKRAQEALDYARNNLTQSHGYGLAYDAPFQGDPVVSTQIDSKSSEQRQAEKHTTIQEERRIATEKLCGTYWEQAREGKAPLKQWHSDLLLGKCDGFVFEMDEDGIKHPVFLQEIIADKIVHGDKP